MQGQHNYVVLHCRLWSRQVNAFSGTVTSYTCMFYMCYSKGGCWLRLRELLSLSGLAHRLFQSDFPSTNDWRNCGLRFYQKLLTKMTAFLTLHWHMNSIHVQASRMETWLVSQETYQGKYCATSFVKHFQDTCTFCFLLPSLQYFLVQTNQKQVGFCLFSKWPIMMSAFNDANERMSQKSISIMSFKNSTVLDGGRNICR